MYQLPSLSSSPASQLSQQEIKESVQAFQDYSKGGHIEADKKAIAAAKALAEAEARAESEAEAKEEVPPYVATDEEALEKLRIADEEMAAALFGDIPLISPPKTSPKKSNGVEAVRSSPDGKRMRWQETFVYGGKGKVKQPEVSLLDLD